MYQEVLSKPKFSTAERGDLASIAMVAFRRGNVTYGLLLVRAVSKAASINSRPLLLLYYNISIMSRSLNRSPSLHGGCCGVTERVGSPASAGAPRRFSRSVGLLKDKAHPPVFRVRTPSDRFASSLLLLLLFVCVEQVGPLRLGAQLQHVLQPAEGAWEG